MAEKGKIFIRKEAFRNMVTHVLRFGNDALEKSIEVMGICVGKHDSIEDLITIENAIPIIHGDKVEIGFDKDMYDLFTQIGEKYASDLIGYYHSHPSWGLYLSESDLKNLQYFQNEKFPHGFCIVFDHTLMGKDNNFGFEIFRLDDYSKPEKYHTVPFEIEIPTTLEYFKWVQKFMEDFQKKTPILIKEIDEFVEEIPRELQEIPKVDEAELIEEKEERYPEMKQIFSSFQRGSDEFSELFMDMIKTQMGDWIDDMTLGTSKGTEYINEAVNKMREAISSGLINVDNWFKKIMDNTVNEFKNSVSEYVDKRIEDNKGFVENISKAKEDLINNLNIFIDDNIKKLNNEMETLFSSMREKFEKNKQINLKFEESLKKLQTFITNTDNQVKDISQEIEKKIENSMVPLQTIFDEKMEKLRTELTPFKENYSEISILLEKLQKIITDFRNLT
ncbi:MAG: hypothetical protein JSV23_02870 [Promethearchaeota archaeon]|nr:MAG: hypothetical protein JSV23_02870 [Candidatus Lokiarchaeota archaeon]